MQNDEAADPVRRRLLRAMAIAPVVMAFPSIFAACSTGAAGDLEAAEPTLACVDDDDDDATAAQTEGPFFKTSSPQRTSLIETGITGTRLALVGLVTTRSCKPIANALVDFWQADDAGDYDNVTFRLRGHQFTDANGAYRLDTVVPGLYPGRTRHIHVKVQAANQPALTTQIYFPGEARNASDGIFAQSLLMSIDDSSSTRQGKFNFVLNLP